MIRRAKIISSGLAALAVAATMAWAGPPNPGRNDHSRKLFAGKLPITELNEQEAILHALNRLGFGPHPGEVEQIQKTGLEIWIQAQLHPENIADPTMDARLAEYPALALSAASLLGKISADRCRGQTPGNESRRVPKASAGFGEAASRDEFAAVQGPAGNRQRADASETAFERFTANTN